MSKYFTGQNYATRTTKNLGKSIIFTMWKCCLLFGV